MLVMNMGKNGQLFGRANKKDDPFYLGNQRKHDRETIDCQIANPMVKPKFPLNRHTFGPNIVHFGETNGTAKGCQFC